MKLKRVRKEKCYKVNKSYGARKNKSEGKI